MADKKVMVGDNLGTNPTHALWNPGDRLTDPDGKLLGSGGGLPASGIGMYVDAVNGSDVTGDGSAAAPYQSISHAYAQVPPVPGPTTPEKYYQWAFEKIIIHVAPGEYTTAIESPADPTYPGDVILGHKRARVELVCSGAVVQGNIRNIYDIADLPDGASTLATNFPPPFSYSPFSALVLTGLNAGVVATNAAVNLIVLGGVHTHYVGTGSENWQAMLRHEFVLPHFVEIQDGITQGTNPAIGGQPNFWVEASGAEIKGAVGGVDNSAAQFMLKCHDTRFGGYIGPFAKIYQLSDCRISGIDCTAGGVTGLVEGQISGTLGLINCALNAGGGSYIFGDASGGATSLYIDTATYEQWIAKGIPANYQGTVTEVLMQTTKGVGYTVGNPADWVGPVPTNLKTALDRMAAQIAINAAGPIP